MLTLRFMLENIDEGVQFTERFIVLDGGIGPSEITDVAVKHFTGLFPGKWLVIGRSAVDNREFQLVGSFDNEESATTCYTEGVRDFSKNFRFIIALPSC